MALRGESRSRGHAEHGVAPPARGALTYRPAFLEHAKRPRGRGRLIDATATGRAENRLCGDEIEVEVRVEGEHLAAIAHRERACAIVVASASLLASALEGASRQEAIALAAALRETLARGALLPDSLAPLAAVRLLPSRHRCALLPWEALAAALA